MCVVVITFTGVMVCVNQVSINGSNYMSPEIAATLTPESRRSAAWGSKMTFALEHFTLSSLWLVKGCLRLVYNRLTWVDPPVGHIGTRNTNMRCIG